MVRKSKTIMVKIRHQSVFLEQDKNNLKKEQWNLAIADTIGTIGTKVLYRKMSAIV